MKQYLPISLIVFAFVALATFYSVVTPLGEGPDEPGHARYVFFLARAGRLPVQQADAANSDVPGEGHQPPLAYVLAAPLAAWLPIEERRFDMPGNPRFTWASPPMGAAELNAVAHGSREYMPWRGFVLAWHLARLVSVALGAATVLLTYLAARALTEERRTTNDQFVQASFVLRPSSFVPLLAAALVAFNPQFLFTSALVTNDALLVTLSAALLWLVVRRPTTDDRRPTADQHLSSIVNRQLSMRSLIKDAIVIGFILGLALITKQSAIILVPVAFLAVLEYSWLAATRMKERASDEVNGQAGATLSPLHPFTPSSRLLVSLSSILAFGVTTALVCGWWYARNWRLYGDVFGLAAFQAEFLTQAFDPSSAAAWIAALAQLHGSFWARFGWMNVLPPGWVIGFFALIELLALAGWLGYLNKRRPTNNDKWRFFRSPSFVLRLRRWWPVLALPLLALGWVISFALTAGLVAWQGRLLFPALPALAIGLACGLDRLIVGGRQSAIGRIARLALWLLPTAFCLLALWLPFGVIRPAYPQHTLREAVALERLGTQVYGRFGLAGEPGAELRGWTLSGSAKPGDTPQLTLMWHALGRQNRNWTVFIHLVDAQGQIVAEDNRPPQDDAFPMLQWVAGDWIEDRHPLALPASLAPGEYHIRVGLYFPRTERRAGVYSKRGTLRGDYLDIGTLTVEG